MATKAGCVFKEFHALARNITKLTDDQAQVELEDELEGSDSLMSFLLSVCPNAGHYKGATIKFRVQVSSQYPDEAPVAECLNLVYHPNINISEQGEPASICVNLLSDDWQPEVGLDGCVIAILFLFHHPNQNDALSHVFSGTEMEEEEFAENVKASIKGGEVEGICFDNLMNEEHQTDIMSENGPESVIVVALVEDSQSDETVTPSLVTCPDKLFSPEMPDDNATDIIPSKVPDPFPNINQPEVSLRSDDTDSQAQTSDLNGVKVKDETYSLPLVDNKHLQTGRVLSGDWKNVAFSFIRWFYHRLKKCK